MGEHPVMGISPFPTRRPAPATHPPGGEEKYGIGHPDSILPGNAIKSRCVSHISLQNHNMDFYTMSGEIGEMRCQISRHLLKEKREDILSHCVTIRCNKCPRVWIGATR